MRDQGQGHIRQRGTTRWELKFDLGRDPVSGKRLSKFVNFNGTKREAQAELNRRVANKTAVRHRQIVMRQIAPRLGQMPMRKLTPVHIEAFEAELQRSGNVKGRKAGQGLTAQTVLHVHRTLSQAFAHAVKTGVLFKNPAEQVKPPRPPRREIAILSKAEVGELLKAAEATPLYLPILIGVTTGMRRGEILGLRWSDIDLKAGRLTVNQSLERLGGKTTFKAPKTAGSQDNNPPCPNGGSAVGASCNPGEDQQRGAGL